MFGSWVCLTHPSAGTARARSARPITAPPSPRRCWRLGRARAGSGCRLLHAYIQTWGIISGHSMARTMHEIHGEDLDWKLRYYVPELVHQKIKFSTSAAPLLQTKPMQHAAATTRHSCALIRDSCCAESSCKVPVPPGAVQCSAVHFRVQFGLPVFAGIHVVRYVCRVLHSVRTAPKYSPGSQPHEHTHQ